jgi:hypothetical protein
MCNGKRDESGAVLILALVFVIVTGIVGVALASLTSSNLMASTSLQAKRGVEFEADGAVDAAIQMVRYNGMSFSSGGWQKCAPGTGALSIDNATVYVECNESPTTGPGAITPPPGGRAVEFIACNEPSLGCQATGASIDLTAQVTFNDISDTGSPQVGTSVTIVSWNDSA